MYKKNNTRKWNKKSSSQPKKTAYKSKSEQNSRSAPPGIYISIDELEIDIPPITFDDRKTSSRKQSSKRKY